MVFFDLLSKDVNFEELARCTDDFNGAQCKAVCVEAVSSFHYKYILNVKTYVIWYAYNIRWAIIYSCSPFFPQGMIALRRDALEVTHEDYMDAILEVQAKKKANLNYYA